MVDTPPEAPGYIVDQQLRAQRRTLLPSEPQARDNQQLCTRGRGGGGGLGGNARVGNRLNDEGALLGEVPDDANDYARNQVG